jgi:hypothetical protein
MVAGLAGTALAEMNGYGAAGVTVITELAR